MTLLPFSGDEPGRMQGSGIGDIQDVQRNAQDQTADQQGKGINCAEDSMRR